MRIVPILKDFAARVKGSYNGSVPLLDEMLESFVRERGLAALDLKEEIKQCVACPKAAGFNRVPGIGPIPADVMHVGEGPGEQEDKLMEPFVGPAGQLLDKILEAASAITPGLNRGSAYITNIVKCRCVDENGKNAIPKNDRIAPCTKHLQAEIELVQPKIIVAWGATAASYLIHPDFKITQDHGKWFRPGEGKPEMMAIYHPAFILHTGEESMVKQRKQEVWDDIRKVAQRLSEIREGK